MPTRRCCIKNCSVKENEGISLFKFPNVDSEDFNLWCLATSSKLKMNKNCNLLHNFICELHFAKDCIDDSSLQRKTLKQGSVPSVFPNSANVPTNMTNWISHANVLFDNAVPVNTVKDDQVWVTLPPSWYVIETNEGHLYCYGSENERSCLVKRDMTLEIRAKGLKATYPDVHQISDFQDLSSILEQISQARICAGPKGFGNCKNVLFSPQRATSLRCPSCQKDRYRMLKREQRLKDWKQLHTKRVKRLKLNYSRALKKIAYMKQRLQESNKRMRQLKKENLESVISAFSEPLKEAVRTAYRQTQIKGPRGMRFSRQWVLECLLIRIKSRKAYLHLLNHKILPLPTIKTLTKQIKNFKPSYGFDPALFKALMKKGESMPNESKRGSLKLDEIKLSEGISFNSEDMTVLGFTDLGKYTPENQKNMRADHALVFQFEPFQGQWTQNLGAFLSKGAAPGVTLAGLIVECIILMEKAGFFVDAVVSDGAQWNRGMWTKFGVSSDEVSCIHPTWMGDENVDDPRRLWFVSDFSHLVKNLRNFLMSKNEIKTPSGIVKKKHFYALVESDGGAKYLGLKMAHKFTLKHVEPKFYEKMKVHTAMEVFSDEVISAMTAYKATNTDLADSDATVDFLKIVNKLITAMTSRSIANSLSKDNESFKAILNFLEYLQKWKIEAASNMSPFLSSNTYTGFLVTLNSALEIMEFLTSKCNFKFLMTSRINQDKLEAEFGLLRNMCGSTDNPDPLLFIEVYRLRSIYCLVKPIRGSSVEGIEIFDSLLDVDYDNENTDKDKIRAEWEGILQIVTENQNYSPVALNAPDESHDYNIQGINEMALTYVAGFVAKKIQKWTKCENCRQSALKKTGGSARDQMIDSLSRGYLKYPSDNLYQLLFAIEKAIMNAISNNRLCTTTFQVIAFNILKEKINCFGCEIHRNEITKRVINYYTIMRSRIICKKHNAIYDNAKQKERSHRKLSKLVGNIDKVGIDK